MDASETTREIIDMAIAHHRSGRAERLCRDTSLNVVDKAKSFKTLSVGFGRQMGTTKYIIDHAKEESDIIIARDALVARFIRSCLAEVNKSVQVITIYDIADKHSINLPRGVLEKDYTSVYVEFAHETLTNQELTNRLYEVFATNDVDQTFVLLG